MSPLHAETKEVPWSRSPDDHWAVFYSLAGEADYTFSVRTISGSTIFPLAHTTELTGDAKTMYEFVGFAADERLGTGSRDASSYNISWSPDGTRVAVSAGQHKFGDFHVYRRNSEGLAEIPFPKDYEKQLTLFVSGSPKIHKMGAGRSLKKSKSVFANDADVCLLEDDYIAVTTHAAECRSWFSDLPEASQARVPDGDLFFLFHAGPQGAAKFVGFCR